MPRTISMRTTSFGLVPCFAVAVGLFGCAAPKPPKPSPQGAPQGSTDARPSDPQDASGGGGPGAPSADAPVNRTEVQADGAGQSGNDGGARPEVRTDGLIDSGRSDAADGGAADTGAGLDAGIPVNPALEAVCTPQVTLTTPDATAAVFLDAMGGSRAGVEAIVQGIGRDVCRVLYRKPEEVRAANSVELVARDYAGVAAKSGDLGRIKVEISTRHLQSVKNAGGDVAREIKGILYHEMTHMYQQDDKPEGTWSGLPSYYEAGADAVRIRYGYLPNGCRPNKNGQWHQHNYCSGGYWWLWVDTKHPDFLYKLNLLMKGRDMKAFTPADATAITGTSLDDLWREYQTAACCSDSSTACCK